MVLGTVSGSFWGVAKGHVLNTPLKSSEVLRFPGFRVGGVVKGHAKGHAKGRAKGHATGHATRGHATGRR